MRISPASSSQLALGAASLEVRLYMSALKDDMNELGVGLTFLPPCALIDLKKFFKAS